MNPFLVVSHKPRVEFWFRSDHEGTSSEILRIGIFNDPEKAAEHIARLDYAHYYGEMADSRDDPFTHRIISIESLEEFIGTVWEDVAGIQNSDAADGICVLADQQLKKIIAEENEAKAKREAAEAEKKAREDQEKAEKAKIEKDRKERAEYERLKQKFENA